MFGSLPEIEVSLAALVLGGAIVVLLHRVLAERQRWLIVILLAALAFIAVTRLGFAHSGRFWFEVARWTLFVVTMGAFVRFRWHPRFNRGNDS